MPKISLEEISREIKEDVEEPARKPPEKDDNKELLGNDPVTRLRKALSHRTPRGRPKKEDSTPNDVKEPECEKRLEKKEPREQIEPEVQNEQKDNKENKDQKEQKSVDDETPTLTSPIKVVPFEEEEKR